MGPLRAGLLNLSVAQSDWQDSADGTTPAIAFLDGQLFQLWDNSHAPVSDPSARVALPVRWVQAPGGPVFQPERIVSTAVDAVRVSLPFVYAVRDDGQVFYLAPEGYESPTSAPWTNPTRQFSAKVNNHYRVYPLNDLPLLESDERVIAVKAVQSSRIEDDRRLLQHCFFLQTDRGRVVRYQLRWNAEKPATRKRAWGEHWEPVQELAPGEVAGQFVPELSSDLTFWHRGLFAPISDSEIVGLSSDGVISLRFGKTQEILGKLPAAPVSLSAYLLPSSAVNSAAWEDRLVVWTVVEHESGQRQVLRWTPNEYKVFEPLSLPTSAVPLSVVGAAAQLPTGEDHAFFRPIGTAGWGERVMVLGTVPGNTPLTWRYEFWGVNKEALASYQWQIPLHHRDPLVPEFRHHPHMPQTPALVALFDKHQQLAEELLFTHFSTETDRLFRLAAVPHFMDANRRRILLRSHFRPAFARGFQKSFWDHLHMNGIASVEAMHFANEFILADGAIRQGILPERVDDLWLAIALMKTPANQFLQPGAEPQADIYLQTAFGELQKRIASQYHLSQADLHSFMLAQRPSYGDLPMWEFTEQILRKIDPLRVCVDRDSILSQFGTVGALP